jgi:hypothetical protein
MPDAADSRAVMGLTCFIVRRLCGAGGAMFLRGRAARQGARKQHEPAARKGKSTTPTIPRSHPQPRTDTEPTRMNPGGHDRTGRHEPRDATHGQDAPDGPDVPTGPRTTGPGDCAAQWPKLRWWSPPIPPLTVLRLTKPGRLGTDAEFGQTRGA